MEFIGYDLLLNLITLTFLEIILGIDNLIFIALVVCNLPHKYRKTARLFGLSLALVIRILMLLTLSWIMNLTNPLFFIGELDFSFKNFLLIFGGLFLIIKSGFEIFSDIKSHHHNNSHEKKEIKTKESLLGAIIQIAAIDFVFSFDSIITAIGMTNNIPIIVAAIIISLMIMLFASSFVSLFLSKYPSLKIVALSFIFMIGIILLADGFHLHISKGYLYFSLIFTLAVESLNIISRKRN